MHIYYFILLIYFPLIIIYFKNKDPSQHIYSGLNETIQQNTSGVVLVANSIQESNVAINVTSRARIPLVLINTINDSEYDTTES